MIEVEVFGGGLVPEVPTAGTITRLCEIAAESRGVRDGHVAVEFVSARRIADLNERHRGKAEPTDVLSFPIDGPPDPGEEGPARELGDILICPPHTSDLNEAVLHGMLHLLGMDHESDSGEMLRLQDELLRRTGR